MRFAGGLRKGVSDLVIILTLIAVAVPIALVVQSWLTSQAGRLSETSAIPDVEAMLISSDKTSQHQIFLARLRNTGDKTYDLTGISVYLVLSNGTTVQAQEIEVIPSTSKLEPGSSVTVSFKVQTLTKVTSIVITIYDEALAKEVPITINI